MTQTENIILTDNELLLLVYLENDINKIISNIKDDQKIYTDYLLNGTEGLSVKYDVDYNSINKIFCELSLCFLEIGWKMRYIKNIGMVLDGMELMIYK